MSNIHTYNHTPIRGRWLKLFPYARTNARTSFHNY